MSKTAYWLRSANDGTYAVADGAEERDRIAAQGYELADEPAETDQVWIRHPGVEGVGRIPYGARPYFLGNGSTLSGPPAPVDLTKDPALTDSPAAPAPVMADNQASGKTATATNKNEGASRG